MIQREGTGARVSEIVIHNDTIYLAGIVGDGKPNTSITEQTEYCLRKAEALLEKAGSSPEHILQTTIWLSDIRDFDEMNAVWDAWVPKGHAPARACGEARLASQVYGVEFIITAAKK